MVSLKNGVCPWCGWPCMAKVENVHPWCLLSLNSSSNWLSVVVPHFALGDCGSFIFFFQAEDGIRDWSVTGVQTCALPIFHALAEGAAAADVVDVRGRGSGHGDPHAQHCGQNHRNSTTLHVPPLALAFPCARDRKSVV